MKIRNAPDFWSGVMFAVVGLAFAGLARQYDMGTAARMGPAYFPTVLGLLLAAIGGFIALRALRLEGDTEHRTIGRFHFKPLVLVLAGVVAFGVLLRPAGMIVATMAMVVIASFGSGEFKWKEVIPLAAALTLLVLVVFIWALGLTIPVYPAFMER